jgi:hypothetical protein
VLTRRLRALSLGLLGCAFCRVHVCVLCLLTVCYASDEGQCDECSTHGVALTRTLCIQLIMFTARLIALPVSFRLA